MAAFTWLLTELMVQEDMSRKAVNDSVDKRFPNRAEYGGTGAGCLFNKLVRYQITRIDVETLRTILQSLDTIYKRIYTNLSTLDNYFSRDIRRPLFEKYGSDSREYLWSKELIKLSYADRDL